MPKFAVKFPGVPEGEIYPTEYQPGDECPPSLLEAARSLGVLAPEPEAGAEGDGGQESGGEGAGKGKASKG